MLSIASTGALLTGSDSGALESRHYLRRGIGRYYQRHESEPGSEIGLECFLIAITLIDWLAGNVGYDLFRSRVRKKLIRCLDQPCHAFEPFAFGAIGLKNHLIWILQIVNLLGTGGHT